MNRVVSVLIPFLLICKGENDLDQMAVSACTGISSVKGTNVAVRRQCNNNAAECSTMCKNAPGFNNGAANSFSCFDSVHVYKNRPDLGARPGGTTETTAPGGVGQYGPVIHRYGGCVGGCGPNYCCCLGRA